jgi:hypothetical protein
MILQRPKDFVGLEVITFAMPFFVQFVVGRGPLWGGVITDLWILLFLASCFQVRRDLALSIFGSVLIWF